MTGALQSCACVLDKQLKFWGQHGPLLQQGSKQNAASAAEDALGMECTSAMAAVSALATGLGAFLAPQLPRVLGVLLDAQALTAGPHGMAASAARARETLTSTIPPRLLLLPLYAHLPAALQVHACYLPDLGFCSTGRLSSTVHRLSADRCIVAPCNLNRYLCR